MSDLWQVYALKYAEDLDRPRGKDFIFTDDHSTNHPMDYFVWLLRRGDENILVDTGFDHVEAGKRGRPLRQEASDMLAPFGLTAQDITTIIVTHLHYDHAGGLHLFPNATLHMQAAEMAYATGPCMCHDVLRFVYTADHICEAVQRLYSGRLEFYDGEGEVSEGVTVHCIGGHSRGMQAVRVRTEAGWLCLASDATHFYENIWTGVPFPIVVDMEQTLNGYKTLEKLASKRELIIPGHDPMVTQLFPKVGDDDIYRLDKGLIKDFPF